MANKRFTPDGPDPKRLSVVSLFTGAGGLDLGLEAAGFRTRICVEIDDDARKTIRANRPRWRLADPADIHECDPSDLLRQAGLKRGEIALLAGGPPCQPFSKSGYWVHGDSLRLRDPRAKTLSAYLTVVEAALPHVLLLENVKGLAFAGKDDGLRMLRRGLSKINRTHGTSYALHVLHINAADYGVPQIRERVFVVASRDGTKLATPAPTHGSDATPYLTAWDAIGHLDDLDAPELRPTGKWASLLPSIPEGENYLWHTPRNDAKGAMPLFGWRTRYWSFLLKLAKDAPAWTIQATPGPATGPFHWHNRRLAVEEMLALQTFPAEHTIVGDWRSAQRQIGNAVPPLIGEVIGLEIRRQLFGHSVRRKPKLLPARREDMPARERSQEVPEEFHALAGKHEDHPGTGFGPGALRRRSALVS